MSTYINTLFIIISGLGILLTIINYILGKTMGKKFDTLLIKHNVSLPPTFSIGADSELSMRAAKYAGRIVFGRSEKRRFKQRKDWYENFDFQAYASKRDIILSWIYQVIMMLFMLASLILRPFNTEVQHAV